MKIAIVTDYNNKTGIGSQNYNLYLGFKRIGVDVDIINLVSPQGFKEKPLYGVNIVSSLLNNIQLSFGYGVFYKFKKSLKDVIRKNKYDAVILGHQGLAYLYKSLSKLNINISIIIDDLFPLYEGFYKGMDYYIYKHFLIYNLNKFKNIVFISDFTKDDYIKYFNNLDEKKYKTIYIGIDSTTPTKIIKDKLMERWNLNGKRIILNVGSEDYRKNIKTFLKVVNHYKDNDNIIFIRVGKKSKESDSYIMEKQLKNILYVSGLSEEELMGLYEISNIVISPSLLEGYGKQIFEGYLYHNFVITTKVSDVEQMFKKDKNIFLIDDPESLSEYSKAIDSIIDNKLVFNASTEIQSIEKEAKEYLEFINN